MQNGIAAALRPDSALHGCDELGAAVHFLLDAKTPNMEPAKSFGRFVSLVAAASPD